MPKTHSVNAILCRYKTADMVYIFCTLFGHGLTETKPNNSKLILVEKFNLTLSLFQQRRRLLLFLCEYNVFLSIKENNTTLLCLLPTNN
mmetsp:Transcript_17695/g.20268  ORF Transcript_17695/g.20268 Transcript_17695/m.20268 type:complete len:89 (+) Transcript_17695:1478-1744(+)